MTKGCEATATSAELTAAQLAVLRCVATHVRTRGVPPSLREIMEETDASAQSVVRDRLIQLERLGLITRNPLLSRSITITDLARETHPELFPASPERVIADAARRAFTAGEALPARVVAALEAEAVPV